jgi:adenylyltransferase/sulfurtransferase
MSFTKEHIARYSRQLILPEIGLPGQQRLQEASVLLIGAGGLGCPAALYLAAAGVGRLGLVDADAVSLSNLHRQVLHATADIGRSKVESAREKLTALNPETEVVAYHARLDAATAKSFLPAYDVVLDGSDNLATRYLVNDACVLLGKPLIYGGAVQWRGQLMVIRPGQSACFRCVFPEPPQPGEIPDCQAAGILGATAGVIGTLMAQEALKLLLGTGQPLENQLLTYDALAGAFRRVPVRRDPDCAVCGVHPSIHALVSIDLMSCSHKEA